MSSFGAKGLTNKGRVLQAKAQAGVQLKYTKYVLGDAQLGGQSIATLNGVISPKKTVDVTRLKMTPPSQATVGFVLSNQDVTTGFYFRELGLYAMDPDDGEILYWYANAGDTADYIPPTNTGDVISKTVDMLVYVGTASNVTLTIDQNLAYVTHDELAEALEGLDPDIPPASLTQPGITQLSNATNSTSETMAATPKAVKDAYDRGSAGVTAAAAAQAKADAAETPAGAQTKANTAETNAKAYSDTNFYKRDQFLTANLVKNSSGLLGLQNWINKGGGWRVWDNPRYGNFIAIDEAVAANNWVVLDSDPILVTPGGTYTLSVALYSLGITATNSVLVEIKAPADSNMNAALVFASPNSWWHTKSVTFTVPAGVNSIAVRLVATNKPAGTTAGYARITLTETMNVQPYSLESDVKALFQSVANGKQAIATAISGKGVPASGSDEFAVLANKISQIKTGIQVATGNTAYSSGPRTIANLPFKPQILIVYGRADTFNNSGYQARSNGYGIAYNTSGTTTVGDSLTAFLYSGGYEIERDIEMLTNVVFGANSVSFDGFTGTVAGNGTAYIIFGV